MYELEVPPSPEEGRSPFSEGIGMSVFPYNCKFRKINLPDYEIACLRINWKGTWVKHEENTLILFCTEKGEAKVNTQEPEDESFYDQGTHLDFTYNERLWVGWFIQPVRINRLPEYVISVSQLRIVGSFGRDTRWNNSGPGTDSKHGM